MTPALFTKVLDGRKTPIRGLQQRNGVFYARLTLRDPAGAPKIRRQRLAATTVAQAREELQRLRHRRDDGEAGFIPRRGFRLADYVPDYLAHAATLGFRPATLEKDRRHLAAWSKACGGLSLTDIGPKQINDFVDRLIRGGLSPRTGNLYLISLRNLLKKARTDGLIRHLPETTWRKAAQAPERHLISTEEFDRLVLGCEGVNGG
jgi:hypothetical protein